MKDYKGFLGEAISAARLAQLAAKGKGGAAAAQMKADGLKSGAAKTTPEQKKLPGGKGGELAGGALATTKDKKGSKSPNSIVKRDDIQNVNVQDVTAPNKDDKQAGQRPGTTKYKTQKKDEKKGFSGKRLKKFGKGVLNNVKSSIATGSGGIGATGGTNPTERGVRYQ